MKDEVFDACLLQSANDNKIGVRLEPASLCRVLRGLVGSEATHVEVKLIKREVAPGTSLPFLCFDSKGVVDVVQDVPLAGPLNRREVEDLETIVQANVVDVPYWLCLDSAATEAAHAAVERFRAVGDVVELATTKAGSLHLTTNKGGHVALGAELRRVPSDDTAVVPVRPLSRGARRSLRTLSPGVSLRPTTPRFRSQHAATPFDFKH